MWKYSAEDMKKLAKKRAGKCLSLKYSNKKQKLRWQCNHGHIWMATSDSILSGSWCPFCAKNRRLTIKEMQSMAKEHHGYCLSKQYRGSHSKLKWKCRKGHSWLSSPTNIQSGKWCPICAGQGKPNIKEIKILAKEREGKCLSKRYINSKTKLEWQCRQGHRWKADLNHVRQDQWCPICGGTSRLNLTEMIDLAKSKEGFCLSKAYINNRSKLTWKCKEGHIWLASPLKVKSGQWCPVCSIGLSERICKEYFEAIFKCNFIKIRPSWLVNSKGARMELDGFNEKLGLAFEYQGKQHYEHISRFHQARSLRKQKIDDLMKKQLCRYHKVVLITVPFDTPYETMGNYIVNQCKKYGIKVPKTSKIIDYKHFKTYSPNKIALMRQAAKQNNGLCLSDHYYGNRVKHKWECQKGHIWEAIPGNIIRGHWCPYCKGWYKTIEDMQALARSKGGKCLSIKYINARTKLKWQCSKGHIWRAMPYNIKSGYWCPFCAGKK